MAVFTPRALQIPNMRTDYSAENSAFSNLGQTLGNMPSEFRKEQLNAQKQQILGQIGTGNLDYEKAGRSLIALGDTQAGATLLTLGQKQQERDLEKAWLGGGAGLGATSTQPMGGSSSTPGKMPPAEIKAIIDANVPEADREYAYRMALKESSFNPGAVSPTGAKGLFQFTGGTGRQYGLVDRAGDIRDNPTANTQAFARFTEDNRQALRQALGRDPTYGELALAHQQGAGGAIALITGNGEVNPNNLRVNNADPNAPRSESARRIMAYYGYGNEQPAPNQTSRQPAQVAQANVPGDDPVKLRSDAQYYAQSNPEAARQLNARADALEQSRGTQVAQAAPQPGQPVADAPASGAKEAQFVLPGTGEVIPQAISTDPAVRSAMGRYVTAPTERTRAAAKAQLDLAVKDAERRQALTQPNDTQRNYELARRQGYQGSFMDYQKELRSAGATNVNVDTKAEGEYAKANGKAISERFSKIVEEGDAANQEVGTLARIRELGGQIKNIGGGAALQGWLAERGIKVGPNVSEIEAYSALIDKLTPQQRIAGAGATSDFDARMFKNSLPGLMRTPGGNELILSTLEALNTYKRQRGDIVAEAMANNEKPAEVLKQLKSLPDPFAGFKEAAKGGFKNVPAAPPAPPAVTPTPPQAPAPPQRPAGGGSVIIRNPTTGQRMMLTPNNTWEPFDG